MNNPQGTDIERIARAIHAANEEVDEHTKSWRYYIPDARAALTALSEPSASMVQAGGAVFGFGGDPETAERVFNAMINAAQGEES